jgi:peptidyl-prolyl cis-trans isomerase A (cyclophilin A)
MIGKMMVVAAAMLMGAASAAQDQAPANQPEKQPEQPGKADPGKADPGKDARKDESKAGDEKKERFVYVSLKTTLGQIVLELDSEKAPISVKNFLDYVESGHYEGTIFHRVIPGFMIQGGGFDKDLNQKRTRPPIRNEWKNGLKNVRGSIAMARTNVADSATSQFFINVKDNPFLDEPRDGAGYAVFGKVIQGMDVCDRIVAVKTVRRGGMADVPESPIVIEKATKITPEEAKKGEEKKPS